MTRRERTREQLKRRGLWLIVATVVWNAFEGAAALAAGIVAHSVALTGYGLDSTLEVFVSGIAAWQLMSEGTKRDKPALRIIGAAFLVVGAYVGILSVLHLVSRVHPSASPFGIAITSSAAVVMLWLGLAKGRVARALRNPVLAAEARFSIVDGALSATVLLGLILNAAFGWWWADAMIALLIAALALREGWEGVRSRSDG